MIRGTGTDIQEISRIQSSMQQKSFLERCFLPEEIEYCMSKPHPANHIAARFCAKEAFAKACGRPQRWREVMITNDENGAPAISLSGSAAEALKGCRIHVSLSHSGNYAAATVIIEE